MGRPNKQLLQPMAADGRSEEEDKKHGKEKELSFIDVFMFNFIACLMGF